MRNSNEINPFGMKKLLEFLEKPNDDVLTGIDRNIQNFKLNLSHADAQKNLEMFCVLVQIIGEKICGDTALPEVQNGTVAKRFVKIAS